jgi:hypothetical protein
MIWDQPISEIRLKGDPFAQVRRIVLNDFFTFRSQHNPAFAGMTRGGGVGRFESQEQEKTAPLHAHLSIEPFKDFCKRLDLQKF